MTDDPRDWHLNIPSDRGHVDLYLELAEKPRALSAEEAKLMVELVDAWRAHEHRKHIALMNALADQAGPNPQSDSN